MKVDSCWNSARYEPGGNEKVVFPEVKPRSRVTFIGQESFAFATIKKTDVIIEYRRALEKSESLAVNKNKFSQPFYLLFTVPEKNEDTGE